MEGAIVKRDLFLDVWRTTTWSSFDPMWGDAVFYFNKKSNVGSDIYHTFSF
jgi:hypothetical protein